MQEIVHQLGELFLQAVPTVLIVLAFYVLLRVLFFKPLLAAMAEREARSAGAQKAAEAAQEAAAEKAQQYQEALKKARAQVYAEQEAARKKLLEESAAQLKKTRTTAGSDVGGARGRLAREWGDEKQDVEGSGAQRGAEIARGVWKSPPRPGGPVREAR